MLPKPSEIIRRNIWHEDFLRIEPDWVSYIYIFFSTNWQQIQHGKVREMLQLHILMLDSKHNEWPNLVVFIRMAHVNLKSAHKYFWIYFISKWNICRILRTLFRRNRVPKLKHLIQWHVTVLAYINWCTSCTRANAIGLVRDVFSEYDQELVFVYLHMNVCAEILARFEHRVTHHLAVI
jgi:hypothetical protein